MQRVGNICVIIYLTAASVQAITRDAHKHTVIFYGEGVTNCATTITDADSVIRTNFSARMASNQ